MIKNKTQIEPYVCYSHVPNWVSNINIFSNTGIVLKTHTCYFNLLLQFSKEYYNLKPKHLL